MANIKSAKKRVLVTEIKTARNKAIKSKVKTCIKKVEAAVANKDKEAANEALIVAISEINKATSKGLYHKNNAARKVSRLTHFSGSPRPFDHQHLNCQLVVDPSCLCSLIQICRIFQ